MGLLLTVILINRYFVILNFKRYSNCSIQIISQKNRCIEYKITRKSPGLFFQRIILIKNFYFLAKTS